YCRPAGAHAAQDSPREAGGLRRPLSACALQSPLSTVWRRGSRRNGTLHSAPVDAGVWTALSSMIVTRNLRGSSPRSRRGSKPRRQETFDGHRGMYAGVTSTICVDEDHRFLPRYDRCPPLRCVVYACYGNPEHSPSWASLWKISSRIIGGTCWANPGRSWP